MVSALLTCTFVGPAHSQTSTAAPSPTATPPPPLTKDAGAALCERAEGLTENGQLDEAEAIYEVVVDHAPDSTCASTGATQIKNARKKAQQLTDRGKCAEAHAVDAAQPAEGAICLDASGVQAVWERLREVTASPLRAAGEIALGFIVVIFLGFIYGPIRPVWPGRGVKEVKMSADRDSQTRIPRTVVRATAFVASLGLVILFVVLVTTWHPPVLAEEGYWELTGWLLGVSLGLGAIAWLAAIAASIGVFGFEPTMQFEAAKTDGTDVKSGEEFAAALEASVRQLSAGTPGGVDRIQSPFQQVEFKALGELTSNAIAKAILALLGMLLRDRSYKVTSRLHPASINGSGLTVGLLRGRKTVASKTFWERRYGVVSPVTAAVTVAPAPKAAATGASEDKGENQAPKQDFAVFYRLAQAAAIWILFQMEEDFRRRRRAFLGSYDVESAALVVSGNAYRDAGHTDEARELFLLAQEADGRNFVAITNLALLDMRE